MHFFLFPSFFASLLLLGSVHSSGEVTDGREVMPSSSSLVSSPKASSLRSSSPPLPLTPSSSSLVSSPKASSLRSSSTLPLSAPQSDVRMEEDDQPLFMWTILNANEGEKATLSKDVITMETFCEFLQTTYHNAHSSYHFPGLMSSNPPLWHSFFGNCATYLRFAILEHEENHFYSRNSQFLQLLLRVVRNLESIAQQEGYILTTEGCNPESSMPCVVMSWKDIEDQLQKYFNVNEQYKQIRNYIDTLLSIYTTFIEKTKEWKVLSSYSSWVNLPSQYKYQMKNQVFAPYLFPGMSDPKSASSATIEEIYSQNDKSLASFVVSSNLYIPEIPKAPFSFDVLFPGLPHLFDSQVNRMPSETLTVLDLFDEARNETHVLQIWESLTISHNCAGIEEEKLTLEKEKLDSLMNSIQTIVQREKYDTEIKKAMQPKYSESLRMHLDAIKQRKETGLFEQCFSQNEQIQQLYEKQFEDAFIDVFNEVFVLNEVEDVNNDQVPVKNDDWDVILQRLTIITTQRMIHTLEEQIGNDSENSQKSNEVVKSMMEFLDFLFDIRDKIFRGITFEPTPEITD